MPRAAPRLCGCGYKIASGSLCPCERQRARQRKAKADANRPTARERGYDSRWQKERAAFLHERPYCERVMPSGELCGRRATVVDHVFPHSGDQRLFWDRRNWAPLCRTCHSGWKQSEEKRAPLPFIH